MLTLILAATFALPMPAVPPREKTARCKITTGGDVFERTCQFEAEAGGSFAVWDADEGPIVGEVTLISVTVLSPGVAEVRGLTVDGVNSRWGEARRSRVDKACWDGSDFQICAY